MGEDAGRSARFDRLAWACLLLLLLAVYPGYHVERLSEALYAARLPQHIDLQLSFHLDEARVVAEQWRSRDPDGLVGALQRWDSFLVVCYALGLWGACRLAARLLRDKFDAWLVALIPWLPLAAGALDLIENALTLGLLQPGAAVEHLAIAVMIVAKLKWILLALAAASLAAALLALLARWSSAGDAGRAADELPEPASLAQVIHCELDAIGQGAPKGATIPGAEDEAYKRAYEAGLRGLAFSGGGIRSATFCLGVLRALALADRLSGFHYLSTVSGGGYIGSWLSAWIRRRGAEEVERDLKRPGRELAVVRFLRSYGNYLTPRKGLFTLDTWTAIATYARNLLLNLIIVVGFAWSLFALLMLVVFHHGSPVMWGWIAGGMICLATVAMTLAVTYNAFAFQKVWEKRAASKLFAPVARFLGAEPAAGGVTHRFFSWLQSGGGVFALVIVPMLVAAYGGGIWSFWRTVNEVDVTWDKHVLGLALIGLLCWAVAFAVASLLSERYTLLRTLAHIGIAVAIVWWTHHYLDEHAHRAVPLTLLAMAIVAILGWSVSEFAAGQLRDLASFTYEFARFALSATVGIIVLAVVVATLSLPLVDWYRDFETSTLLPEGDYSAIEDVMEALIGSVFGPPVVLAGIGAGVVCGIGLASNAFSDKGREWWSRVGGWIMVSLLAWVALVAIPLAVPGLMTWLRLLAGEHVGTLLSWSWAALTTALTLFARGRLTQGKTSPGVRIAVALAPHLFAAGIVMLLAYGFYEFALRADDFLSGKNDTVWEATGSLKVHVLSGVANLAAVNIETWRFLLWSSAFVALLFAMSVDINRFSLHDFYRNRLVRCYLGASNPRRQGGGRLSDVDSFTGFSPSDDMPMSELCHNLRPYHIVNAALNIVKTDRLAWQERKAASFVFTPLYSGYALPDPVASEPAKCFRRTSAYARSPDSGAGVSLGTAMAISGAAISPNMGRLTTPAFAALMTVLDLRLGCWMPNPGRPTPPHMPSPPLAAQYLFYELLGLTDEKRPYVYLSDGGHFDNLGVYELVRRRCRLIVAVDAGADPERNFEDLGICIRKCQVDLGVKIELDVAGLEKRDDGTSALAFKEGTILYPEGAGRLIYVKPGVIAGSEKLAQLKSFRRLHDEFPHQPTTDQWFEESQFESYRTLGELIAGLVAAGIPAAGAGPLSGRGAPRP